MLRYKGYTGSMEYSIEDDLFFGSIMYISDLVMYHSEQARELEFAFQEAVEQYLKDCRILRKEPQTPTIKEITE